jgi:hypothetical protein
MIDHRIINEKAILRTEGRLCDTPAEVLQSEMFHDILTRGIRKLEKINSVYIETLKFTSSNKDIDQLIDILELLTRNALEDVRQLRPKAGELLEHPNMLNGLVEFLYNYWREYERYIICDTKGGELAHRPYRTFHDTVEQLAHIVRKIYRDITENITNTHPKTYRQVNSGAEFAGITSPMDPFFEDSAPYNKLKDISVIHQIMMNPPLILNTTMNKRKGQFQETSQNPLELVELNSDEWLCYPAKVGNLMIHIYFHQKFFELGFAACNLFELAHKDELLKKPDAIYVYGVPGNALDSLADIPTVFYEDKERDLLVGACPNDDEFGYFGYLKKMVLTLHNIIKIRSGILPFHGSLVEISLQNGKKASVLMIGDSGAGKSETLEAYKDLGEDLISDTTVIADDMGSIEIDEQGQIKGLGTEIGAFLRLDDLQPGYAFGQIDRSIILNAHQTNARIILPVAYYDTIMKGTSIDYIFYANNYEEVDDGHPIIEKVETPEEALDIFSKGQVMSKGTTNTKGLVSTYFANIFGPIQFKDKHQEIAAKYFNHFYQKGIFVGQIRTQLGIKGMERKGPEEAARALIDMIS